MADKFIETTTTSYGTRVANSIKGLLVGICLFLGSFAILYWNEGIQDKSLLAKTAHELPATPLTKDPSLQARLVSITGALESKETIDDTFLAPDRFMLIKRKVEIYGWQEHTTSSTKKNVGGSETTETTYSYEKTWLTDPSHMAPFKHPEGHENFSKTIDNSVIKSKSATVGDYSIDMTTLEPSTALLRLTPQNTILKNGAQLATDQYLFISKSGSTKLDSPEVGDMRVSYYILTSGQTATIFGQLDGNKIVPHFDDNHQSFYFLSLGDRNQAIATLHLAYKTTIWVLRLLGFLMMWIGLSLLFTPLSTVLDVLPFLGSISNSLISIIMFLVALPLTLVTILISMIMHSMLALIITAVISIILISLGLLYAKKKK